MKKKILFGAGALALVAGSAYAYSVRATNNAFYFDGTVCRQISVLNSTFTLTPAGGTQAGIVLRSSGGAVTNMYSGGGTTSTCNGTPIYLKP